MEVVRFTGQSPSKYPQVAVNFGTNTLVTSVLPNQEPTGTGGFLEVKLDNLAFADQAQLRQFAATTVEIFINSQEQSKKYETEPIPQGVVSGFSVAYRGAILDLVESFHKDGECADMAILYSQLDCVWHFCEIMFISSHPELPILPYYMDWIKVNFDDTEGNLMRIIPELPELDPEGLDLLWNMIFKNTFHGKTYEASKLLEYANQQQSAVFGEQLTVMIELMKKKPEFKPAKGASTDFNIAWHTWREQIEVRLQSHAFYESEHLTLLAKVLAGRDDGLLEARSQIGTWYEYLCMMLNYQYPLLRPASLKAYARKAIDEYGDFTLELTNLDNILLSAMDYDIVTVLKDMQTQWNHPWFPLHFSDLIYSGGVYSSIVDSRIDYKSVGPIRHELVKEYGIQLMQHAALWEIGVIYLSSIPAEMGLPVMGELLSRLKLTSEMEVEKILRYIRKFEFIEQHQSICRQMAVSKLHQGQLQNALLWAIRAQDAPVTTTVVDKILENENVQLIPVLVELIPKFTSCGERLFFLRGYCEFHNMLQQKRFDEAIPLLCRMVEQNIIPKSAVTKLLTKFRDAMDNPENETKITNAQISLLLQFLHTKVDRTVVPNALFYQVNKILLRSRRAELLAGFNLAKNQTVQRITSKSFQMELN